MKVEVTEEDIAAGRREDCEDCEGCPVALAIRRVNGGTPFVTKHAVQFLLSGTNYTLPLSARNAIHWFDTTGHMEPFSFDLDLDGDA